MATAISYQSESGDDYLSLYGDESIAEIVAREKEEFDEELAYLYIENLKSTSHNIEELRNAIRAAIEDAITRESN